jgi:ABC-type multidrug transport system ATPase subunit
MELWDAIHGIVADGTDVLLTTQYLEEADRLARDVVIIDHGRVIEAGTPDQLKDRAGRNVIEVRPRAAGDLVAVEEALAAVATETPRSDIDSQRASAAVAGGAEQLAHVVRLLDERRVTIDDGLRRPTLDEVFLALTGSPSHPFTPLVNAIRSLMLGGTDAAGLGHTTTYWVAVSLGWWAAITAVFGGLAVSRFARTR